MTIRIAGGGPAGLTAAYLLAKRGENVEVYEQSDILGGIARTVTYKGYRFDIGGHRFFSKSEEVQRFWHEILTTDFLKRPRQSRIYYKKKFFDYPLKPLQAFFGLGPAASFQIFMSYLWIRIRPLPKEDSLEEWVINRFGRRLYRTFFQTYTEKVWGIPCSKIQADWGAQRIKGLSLSSAITNALRSLLPRRSGKQEEIKTLIREFEYPRLGPGQMWETCGKLTTERGGKILMNTRVTKIRHDNRRILAFDVSRADGRTESRTGDSFVSSLPIRELINGMDPLPPKEVMAAANGLTYRDFITIALIINKENIFTDNWIYIHDPDITMGRIQNFKNWSPNMVADPKKTCLGLEYFANEGDSLWQKSDSELLDLGKREVVKLGFAAPDQIEDGTVVRCLKTYPVYDGAYKGYIETIKHYLSRFPNLFLIGRNGLHKYNNQDHSMLTAMRSVDNMYGAHHDIWMVNAEDDYHEAPKGE